MAVTEETEKEKVVCICYVCGKVIKNVPVRIGQDKARHSKCEPGSIRWMSSEIGKKSAARDYWPEPKAGDMENMAVSDPDAEEAEEAMQESRKKPRSSSTEGQEGEEAAAK